MKVTKVDSKAKTGLWALHCGILVQISESIVIPTY